MAQRIINGEQYDAFLVRGDITGAPLPITTGLGVPPHDYISLGYSSGNLTSVVYRNGGASGTIVTTLALTYDANDNLLTVTRS